MTIHVACKNMQARSDGNYQNAKWKANECERVSDVGGGGGWAKSRLRREMGRGQCSSSSLLPETDQEAPQWVGITTSGSHNL